MNAQTKSRASRAAEAAEADAIKSAEAGDIEPTTEAAEQAAAAAIKDAEAAAKGKLPTATLNPGRYPYFMFRPAVTGPDGTVHTCEHRDGHASIKSMMVCARSLGSDAGLAVPSADPTWVEGGPGEAAE